MTTASARTTRRLPAILAIIAVALASAVTAGATAFATPAPVPAIEGRIDTLAAPGADHRVVAYVGAVAYSGAELATGRSVRGGAELAALAAALLVAVARRRARLPLTSSCGTPRFARVPCASRAPPRPLVP